MTETALAMRLGEAWGVTGRGSLSICSAAAPMPTGPGEETD